MKDRFLVVKGVHGSIRSPKWSNGILTNISKPVDTLTNDIKPIETLANDISSNKFDAS